MPAQQKVLKRFRISGESIIILHNSGFFSNCSVSLHAIAQYVNLTQKLPKSVDFSQTFRLFKDLNFHGADVYLDYFEPQNGFDVDLHTAVDFPLSSLFDYREQSYSAIGPLVDRYFTPSRAAIRKSGALREKYGMDPNRLVAICYRGTDKHLDTTPGSFDTYIDETKRILEKEPHLDILVQTDQRQFLDYAREQLGPVLSLDELPQTTTSIVMHNLIREGKVDWAQTFVGATHLIAQSRHLVIHTGNVGRWLCLYRGHMDRVSQYYHPKGSEAGRWIR